MPFFPGESKRVSRSRQGSPVPVIRIKNPLDQSKLRTGTTKRNNLGTVRDHHRDEVDSQTDTAFSLSPSENLPKYFADEYRAPRMPRAQGEGKHDNGRGQAKADRRAEQFNPQMDSDDLADRTQAGLHISSMPVVPIYEHCLLLRKHGISVRFGQAASSAMAQQSRSIRPHITAGDNFARDVYHPSDQAVRIINQAINFVLRNGGEVDMSGLGPEPDNKCPACRERFENERDLDDHCSHRNNSCQHCSASFPCRILHEDHLRDDHKIQLRQDFEPHFDGRSARDGRDGRDDRGGRDDRSAQWNGGAY